MSRLPLFGAALVLLVSTSPLARPSRCHEGAFAQNYYFLGEPRADSVLGKEAKRVAAAIRKFTGHDVDCLRVVVADETGFKERYWGGRSKVLKKDIQADGFHVTGVATSSTIFIKKAVAESGDPAILIAHEVLHSLSQKTSAAAGKRRANHLLEGLTEYFARRVAVRFLGYTEEAMAGWDHPYNPYVAVAKRIAEITGERKLLAIYLDEGYEELARVVDGRLGRGTLWEAARAIERDDPDGALSSLEASEAP